MGLTSLCVEYEGVSSNIGILAVESLLEEAATPRENTLEGHISALNHSS